MQKIHFSFVKDLKNSEFKELFVNILTNIDNANIENDTIQAMTTVLKSHVKPLRKLKSSNTRHPLTAVLDEKLETRTKCLTALRLAIDTCLLWYIPKVRNAAETLKPWLERYKEHLYRTTISEQSNVVKSIIDDKNKDKHIQKAITLLQLDGLMEEIAKLTDQISQTYLQRNSEIVDHQKIMTGLRKRAYKDLQLLMNSIMLFYKTSNNEEKEKLFELNRDINGDFITFRAKLLSRRTKNRNKREINTAVETLIDTGKGTSPANENSNLPMVIYDVLKINSEYKPSKLNLSQKNTTEKTSVKKTTKKETEKTPSTKKGLNDSHSSKNNKKTSGDDKLPPLSRN